MQQISPALPKSLEIGPATRVFDILERYGDIAPVMETFGVKRVGRFSIRRLLTRARTVERAAKIHRVPLPEFLTRLRGAISQVEEGHLHAH